MHCPKCGQQQISDEIRYCSRCGFLLTGVATVVANNGELPGSKLTNSKKDSPRKRGIKKGAFVFLLTFFVVPILTIMALALNAEPIAPAVAAVILIFGGLLRVVYALMFESNEPGEPAIEEKAFGGQQIFPAKQGANAELPAASEPIPANVYSAPRTGAWRDTNDLGVHGSVTDTTTKLLSKRENQ